MDPYPELGLLEPAYPQGGKAVPYDWRPWCEFT